MEEGGLGKGEVDHSRGGVCCTNDVSLSVV